MKKVTQRNHFIFFTLSLVVVLVASSISRTLPHGVGNLLLQVLILITFFVAYSSLSVGSRWRLFVGLSIALLLGAMALRAVLPWHIGEFIRAAIGLIFYLAATFNAGRQVLHPHSEVSLNTIVGALAVYLLLGIVWASLYEMVLYIQPGAFSGIEIVQGRSAFPDTLFFSYVTLTTLGYGDITPATRITQTLAYLEAIAGTFYLAIVVASLVSARRQQSGN